MSRSGFLMTINCVAPRRLLLLHNVLIGFHFWISYYMHFEAGGVVFLIMIV